MQETVSPGGCPGILHRIERGDTLYLLGKKYQVSVAALMFANPYTDIYNLQIGDELCIPRIRRASRQDSLEVQPRRQDSLEVQPPRQNSLEVQPQRQGTGPSVRELEAL